MKRILLFTMMCLFGLFSLNAQSSVVDLSKQYRVKLVSNTNSSVGVGQYLTIESYASHADGPAGGVALKDYAESNAQIFTLEDTGNNTYYFKSADGYYIYCQSWNVDAYSTAYAMTALGMTDLGDGTFNLMNGTKHFKVEYVYNSGFDGNYPFCDASTASTTWTLEAVDNGDEPEPTPEPEEPVTVTIGDGSKTTVSAPINNQGSYGYSYSQQIYLKDEIGKEEGLITSIAFHNNIGGPNTRNIVVLMNNTEKASYAGTQISDLVPVTDADIVYEGEFTFGANEEWATIELQTPFVYTGGNLAITINDKTGVSKAYSGYDKFYASTTTEVRALYKANYTSTGAILNDASNVSYMTQLTASMYDATILIPDVQLTIAPLQAGVLVDKEEIALGTVQLGEYWSEKEDVTVEVSVKPIKTTITNIAADNDFFVLPTLDLTSDPVEFEVSYNKNAAAGEYSGNLTITYGDGETKVVPMTATAYEPATADVYEKAQELTFENGVATATPDFAALHDDYSLLNEVNEGNTPDAAYKFTLTGDATVSVSVSGTNAVYAIYKAEDLTSDGPKADNNFVGEKSETEEPTTFFYDFESENVLDSFTLSDKDGDGKNWGIETYGIDGKTLKSFSYQGANLTPDNYIVTKEKYLITSSSSLSFKYYTVSGCPDKFGVEVSTDGVNFTNIWNIKVASGATIEQTVSLADYAGQELYIALRHYESNGAEGYYVLIDDLRLEDGISVYPAGTYYLVAAAEDAFTVTVTAEVEEPTAPAAPQNLAATSTETSITLTWSPVDGATDYYVYRDSQLWANTSGDTTYTENGLDPYTGYCFNITAVNATDDESEPAELCYTTKKQLLPAPQNLVATSTETSITLTWDAVDGAKAYAVFKDGVEWNSSNGTTYTESDLTPGTEYCFEICAYDASYTYGEKSTQVCATTESVQLAENEIIIGTATTKYYSPFLTILGGGSWFEAIYKSEEIGKACTISELAFSYKDGNETSADINIYLAETTKDEYANPADATAESALTLVYSGTAVTLCDEEWETFALNAPFNYSGENNLIVVVTTANTELANNWNCYSDANTVLIKDFGLDSKKPVLKFTLGEESETPVVVLPYRLQSITGENENDNLYYVYSEDESRVERINKGSYATLVEYNEDGTVAKTSYVFMWNGAPDYTSDYTVTNYTYTDGVLTSYTETKNYNWRDPETSEYALSYNEDGTVAEVTVDNRKYAYEYENGKLVKETYSYYDSYYEDYVSEYIKEFEYDENGNCVTETKYNAYQNPPVAQSGVDYFYDLNVEADSVYVFAYPHEVLPTHAYLVTKAVTYYYNQDWETGEVTKGDFSVNTYNYNEEVVNAPVAPTNLVANVLNDTEVVLTWETLEEVESFKVYNGTELVSEGLVAKTDTVKGLEPLTEYTFTVVAVNGELESAASEEVKATTYNLVNVNPTEIAFGKVIVGDYWLREQKSVEVSIDRFGKEVKAVKTDNKFFRMTSPELTANPIVTTINYNKNSEAGEYEGNLLVILASGDTVSFPLTATAYTPVTPDVFELAQAIETVDGVFSDMPDFATLTDDYKLPGEDEDGNRPDAVYSFTLAEEASVEIDVESNSYDGIYAIYKAPFEGNGPSTDNAVKGKATGFSYDFEDGSLEDFEIQDNDGDTEHTMKVEDGALVSWSYIYDYENYVTVVSYANECAVTKEAYNITEKSVLTFDARFKDGNGNGTYDQVTVQVTKDGETYTDIDWVVNEYDYTIWNYSAEFNTYRVDLGAKFAEKGLEYGEYRVALLYSSGSGSVAIDNVELTEAGTAIYPAGDYYLVAASSSDFKVTVKSDALPELELNKEAHYRLVSTESELNPIRYNYASKVGTKVVNIKDGSNMVDFLRYSDEGQLLGFVSCYMDENGGIYDTISELEYIYEDSVLVGYKEKAAFGPGQVQEKEYVFHYNADGRIDTVRCEASDEVTVYTYNAEGLLVEKTVGYDNDGEFSFESKEVYTYADSNLVKVETMSYDWEAAAADTLHILPLDSLFSLAEEKVYEYDSLGNVISAKSYECYYDEYNDTLIKNLWTGVDYVYDYSIAYENVFYFEYPHYAYSSYTSPAKPSHANIILAEDSYYCYFNEELGEYVYHTQNRKTYRYEEYELEGEDAPVAPATPQNFVATATSDSEIVLTWNKVEGALTYNVYQGTETLKEGLTDTTYTVTGLAAATTYTFEVAAVNGELVSNRATANATTLDAPTAPAAPVVTAEATSDTTIVLTWNKVEDALSYNVYNGTETLATALTDTTFVVKGLKANTEYTFGVTAVNAVGGESARGEAKAKTLEATPDIVPVTIAAPDTLLAEALSASSIKLTWTSVENAVSYNVYVNDSLKASATDTVYTVEGLEYNTEYVFAVTAVLNDTVESAKSPEVRVKTLGEGLAELSATVNIYPNPAVDRLVIETDSYVEEVSIYAITGTLVYKEVDFNSNAIDVSELRGGVYVMKVRTENGEVVKRFVKK